VSAAVDGERSRRIAIPIVLCMAVAVLEGFDIQAMGLAAPRMGPEFGFVAGDMKWLFSISNIGMVLGAALGGWLADRFGRKPVLIGAAAMFGLFTLGTVVSYDFQTFFIARLLTGLGFGAALPNLMAIAAELSSPTRRALTASVVFCGLPLGGGSAAWLTQLFPPEVDWRLLFIVGGALPVLLVPALIWLLPETLSGTAPAAPLDQPKKARVPVFEALFAKGRAAPTLLLWLTFFPTLLILYLLLNWLPTLAVAKGLDPSVAPQASLAFNFASIGGALLLGWLVDRTGSRWPLTLSFVGLMGALLALASATELAMIVTLSGVAGFFLLGANYALYGVVPSYYPAAMRGTGAGASVAVGRVGSIAGPFVPGLLLESGTSAVQLIQYLVPVAAVAGLAVFVLSFFRRQH
jgi:MFS transporter, AAHS family, 3-hydroxyphenylpropionic acid transporter